MKRKEMESDLYISILWMAINPQWSEDKRIILNAIKSMKQIKPIRIYKKRYNLIHEYILDCMKYEIATNRMEEFKKFIKLKED